VSEPDPQPHASPPTLPLSELLDFSAGEMVALKRRGMISALAATIAEIILEGDRGPRRSGGRRLMRNCFGAVFWGTDPPTDFETLVETIAKLLTNWGPGCRDKVEAIVRARRKCLLRFRSYGIEADEFAEFQSWLGDRLIPTD
jgi:hypothetical protein